MVIFHSYVSLPEGNPYQMVPLICVLLCMVITHRKNIMKFERLSSWVFPWFSICFVGLPSGNQTWQCEIPH